MRVVVTGGAGFIGSYVVRQLVRDGHDVGCLLRPTTDTWRIGDLLPKITRLGGDLSDGGNIAKSLADYRPDGVIHLAWRGVGNALRNDPVQIENLHDALALIRGAHAAGAKSFIGLGSQAEYGPTSGALDETAATNPTTLYGVTKLSTYHFARHLTAELGLRLAWLRLFSAYGPTDDPAWMIPSLILKLADGARPPLTPGEQRWDYVHARDAAAAIVCATTNPSATGLFNLGSGEARPIRAVAEMIRDLIDPKLPLGFGDVAYRPDQVMHLEAKIDRLRAIGFSPKVALPDGLQETARWYLEHRTHAAPAAAPRT